MSSPPYSLRSQSKSLEDVKMETDLAENTVVAVSGHRRRLFKADSSSGCSAHADAPPVEAEAKVDVTMEESTCFISAEEDDVTDDTSAVIDSSVPLVPPAAPREEDLPGDVWLDALEDEDFDDGDLAYIRVSHPSTFLVLTTHIRPNSLTGTSPWLSVTRNTFPLPTLMGLETWRPSLSAFISSLVACRFWARPPLGLASVVYLFL
ncbi:hypothetical protein ACLOJK_007195 [Asimina triloba]